MIIAINFQFKQSFLSIFCGLDKSTIPPVDLQLSTTLFLSAFSVPICIHLPVVTLSDNDSKQIATATMSALLTLRTFLVKVKKNLVNSENKENLSNYQLLKRKPSVRSSSLHFTKLITVVRFFFSRNTGSAMVSVKFWRGNFRGRLPGTSALRMLMRLTAVKAQALVICLHSLLMPQGDYKEKQNRIQ